MYKLRYYLAEIDYLSKKNREIKKLLEDIKNKYNIDNEIIEIKLTKEGYTDEKHLKEIYQKEFIPRAKVLKQRIGAPLRKTLKSKKGHIYIAGVITILENGQIGWYVTWEDDERYKKYDKDNDTAFLKALVFQGPSLFIELCPNIDKLKSIHDLLIDNFVKKYSQHGEIEREVRIGSQYFSLNFGTYDWRKSIDIVFHTEKGTWIIEAKPKINWEAFGQVIAYAHLYKKYKQITQINMGIICKDIDQEISKICEEFNIQVFFWEDNEFKSQHNSLSKLF